MTTVNFNYVCIIAINIYYLYTFNVLFYPLLDGTSHRRALFLSLVYTNHSTYSNVKDMSAWNSFYLFLLF